jgi:hypothetical protein
VELSERPLHEELCLHPAVRQLGWPEQVLQPVVGVAVRCAQPLTRERSTITAEMALLEATLELLEHFHL